MSDFWYSRMPSFDMEDFESANGGGMDVFLDDSTSHEDMDILKDAQSEEKTASQGGDRRKVSSMEDLSGFQRVAGTDTLVRMSEKDLWALEEDEEEEDYVIRRLYDDDGNPLEV